VRLIDGIRRYAVSAVLDLVVVALTYMLAIAVRTGGRPEVFDPELAPFSVALAFSAGIFQVICNLLFAVYWRDWSAAALEDMVAIFKACALVIMSLLAFNLVSATHWIPTGAILAGGSLSFLLEAALHLRPRWPEIARAAFGRSRQADNLIVVGAGRLAQLFAADAANGERAYRIACFVDDNPRKVGSYVRGIRVQGRVQDLPELLDYHDAASVVIAIASPPSGLIRRVIELCAGRDARIHRVSGLSLLRGDTSLLEPIGIEQLLAREPVNLAGRATREHYGGKRILVTGAAGSIGSLLSRHLAGLSPERLYLLDLSESGLHDVYNSLGPHPTADIVLGDIRDRAWLAHTFATLQPQVVFHAAAYKHVPILERSPLQGIATNVIGTANVLDRAMALNVERFVFVSTDKAVEPSSVLGYTKRFGELLTIAHAHESSKAYAVVRFGNVLASAGSAIPLFTSQIDNGGPVTVTHPEATRYFMTIEEAVGLVVEAGALAASGDLLVLDMGQPVLIAELAEKMIRLRGLRTPADIEIHYIGLRPGEKLHERLFGSDEQTVGTSHPRIMRVSGGANVPAIETLGGAVRALADRVQQQDADGALDLLTAVIGVERPVHEPSLYR
jgi:FlaA1/EpsC-like NDP-sugar epimerase